MSAFDLTGRTALVSGAARGLGRAIALALADAGADVALGLRDKTADGGLVKEIEAKGRKALPLQMDVLDLKQGYAAIDAAIASFGKLDILINNAGGGVDERPIEAYVEADYDFVLDLNVKSTFFLSQHAGKHMLARPAFKVDVLERIAALHRIGQPREVADAVVFLASDAASLITGQTLLIDGGWTSR